MIQAAAINPVTPRVAGRAPHVALLELCQQARPRAPWPSQVERLGGSRAVVEVQSSFGRTAVDAPRRGLHGHEEPALTRGVSLCALRVSSPPLRVRSFLGVACSLSRLVALPSLWRVGGLATGHMGILRRRSEDTWGDEALNHVDLESA